MEITEIPVEGYERVVRAKDPASGLHALISIHDTTLGPALGGCRMWHYSREEDAVTGASAVWFTFAASLVLYTALGIGTVLVLRAMARRWREPGDDDLSVPYGPSEKASAAGGARSAQDALSRSCGCSRCLTMVTGTLLYRVTASATDPSIRRATPVGP